MVMMFMKLFVKIVKFMAPWSRVQALGQSQYGFIVNMYKLLELLLFSYICREKNHECMVIMFIKSSTSFIYGPWIIGSSLGRGQYVHTVNIYQLVQNLLWDGSITSKSSIKLQFLQISKVIDYKVITSNFKSN